MPADPIEHVIVLMLENRSFDHMLGVLQSIYPKLEGIPPQGSDRYDTDSNTGTKVSTAAKRRAPARSQPLPRASRRDAPDREPDERLYRRLCYSPAPARSKPANYQAVMGYYPMDFLPVLHTLAEEFQLSATTGFHRFRDPRGRTDSLRKAARATAMWPCPKASFIRICLRWISLRTRFSTAFRREPNSWGIFHHGLPISLVLRKLWDHPFHFHEMDHFYAICKYLRQRRYPTTAILLHRAGLSRS